MLAESSPSIGRFAPTPSGPLHQGSLVAALGSWLDARARQGQWRLRIDDLDRERTRPQAIHSILRTLEDHGLAWDGSVVYQSQRTALYETAIETLRTQDRLYGCACSRKRLMQTPGPYAGRCRQGLLPGEIERALRVRVSGILEWTDRVFGPQKVSLEETVGDFIVRRADGYIAYHLATVVDDDEMGVNSVIRGGDLLTSTAAQMVLRDQLHLNRPSHGHLPVLKNAKGLKLSKQNHAPALDPQKALDNLYAALMTLSPALRHPLPALASFDTIKDLLAWAQSAWALQSGLWGPESIETDDYA